MDAPLIITAEVRAELRMVRSAATRKPTDMRLLKPGRRQREYQEQMNRQTVMIPGPWPFFVTFSIENGHPVGTCRHMSMSIRRAGRVPHPTGVWMVAEELGFVGGLATCRIWIEDLNDGGKAINVLQPLSVQPLASA